MVELAGKNQKTVAINMFKHYKRRNENNEGLEILSIEKTTIKNASSHISNWSLKENRKKGDRTYIFRDIIGKLPNLVNNKVISLRSSMNVKQNIQETTAWHIITKLLKTNRSIFKTTRGNESHNTYRITMIKMTADFS